MNTSMSGRSRIAHYDILRGIAISLMLMANSAAYSYSALPPLPMRVVGSFAAPCFMMLAGMMLALNKKPRPLRGLYIIMVGALVDTIIWRIIPFVTYDVLYTIGAAIAITAYPARLFSAKTLWGVGTLFILTGQGLQWAWGYDYEVFEIALPPEDPLPPVAAISSRIIRQLFVDGWFPLFPWLGFVWLGAALQRSLQLCAENNRYPNANRLMALGSILSLVVFSAYWAKGFVAPEPRMDYTELFYPPDAGYCFTYASAFCVVWFGLQALLRWRPIGFFLEPLRWMGQCSLLIYVLHIAAIQYVLSPYFETPELDKFFLAVFMLWSLFALTARVLLAYRFLRVKAR